MELSIRAPNPRPIRTRVKRCVSLYHRSPAPVAANVRLESSYSQGFLRHAASLSTALPGRKRAVVYVRKATRGQRTSFLGSSSRGKIEDQQFAATSGKTHYAT